MKENSSAWGYPHAPAVTRWSRMVLAFTLSAALLVSALPVGALAEGTKMENQVEAAGPSAEGQSPNAPETPAPADKETPALQESPRPVVIGKGDLENGEDKEDPKAPENPEDPENPGKPDAPQEDPAVVGGNTPKTYDAATGAFYLSVGTHTGYYSKLTEAITDAAVYAENETASIQLQQTPSYTDGHENVLISSGTYELDLNGFELNLHAFQVSGGVVTLKNSGGNGYLNNAGDGMTVSGGTLNLSGAEIKGEVKVTGGTMNLSGGTMNLSGGTVGILTVSGGTLNVSGGAVTSLEVWDNSDGTSPCSVQLFGGVFNSLFIKSGDKKVADLLKSGYAIKGSDGQYARYDGLECAGISGGDNAIVECKHSKVEESGQAGGGLRCSYCNAAVSCKAAIIRYENPDDITYCMSLKDAIDGARPADTVRLFSDEAGDVIIPEGKNSLTLDLNGHNIYNLKAEIYCYLKNSDETKGGTIDIFDYIYFASAQNPIKTEEFCKEGSWLKIDNKWAGEEVTLYNGTLTDIQVCATPIQSIAITPGTDPMIHPGESVTLTAQVTTLSGTTGTISYCWSEVDPERDLSGDSSYTFTPPTKEEENYHLRCKVTYDGFTRSVGITVRVKKWDISEEGTTITLPEQPVYDGNLQGMNCEGIQWNGKTLTCNVDYTVTWAYQMSDAIDVEEKTATIVGRGNYKGQRTVTWSLRKATEVPDTYGKFVESKIYYAKDHTGDNRVEVPLPELPKGGEVTEIVFEAKAYNADGTEYKCGIFPSEQPGIIDGKPYYSAISTDNPVYAYITLTVKSQNYEPYQIKVRVSLVDKIPVTIKGTMENDKLEYNGGEQEPVVTLTVTPEVELVKQYFRYSEQTQVYESIQGKPKNAGSYKVIYSVPQSNEIYEGSQDFLFSITPKNITVYNITAIGKEYDGDTSVGLLVGNAKFRGVYTGDEVKVTGNETAAAFETPSAGENKKVRIYVNNMRLDGADAGNYALQAEGSQTETTATIDRRDITVYGLGVEKKTYDGTTEGKVVYSYVSFDGLITGDKLTLEQNAVATFESASAGTNKKVTITNLTLSGPAAGNYRLVDTAFPTEADIEKREVTVTSIQTLDKDYDGGVNAQLGPAVIENVVAGDTLTVVADGTFCQAGVGSNLDVTVTHLQLQGSAAENYTLLTETLGSKATIRRRTIEITGGLHADKTYDGNVTAVLGGTAVLGNVVAGERLTLAIDGAEAVFDDPNVGDNKTVTVQGSTVTLTGDTKDNYSIPDTFTLKAAITKAPAPTAGPGSLRVANGYAGTYTFDFSALLPALSGGQEYGTVSYGSPTVSLGSYYGSGAAVSENGILTLPILQNDATTVGNVGTVTVAVQSRNFADVTLTLNVHSSNRKLPTGGPTLTPDTLTYGEPLSTITLSGSMYYEEPTETPGGEQVVAFTLTDENGRVQVPGMFTWNDPTAKPNVGSYTAQWLFTPADPVTYLSVSGTATIQVLKAQQEAPKAPELESRGHNSITLKAIPDNANGAKAQYRLGDGAWQDSPTFTGLTAGEEYVFQARYTETENFKASPESRETKFTTLPYTLTFQVNGGSAIDSVEAKAGTVISLSGYKPTRSGYSFAGWYAEENLQTRVASVTMNDDTTVYARWTVRNSSSPATGDGARLAMGGAVLALSAGALAMLLAARKKRGAGR